MILRRFPPMGIYETLFKFAAATGRYMGDPGTHPWAQGYPITTPVPELAGETREIVHPILRHQDGAMYFRQHADRYGIGSYDHIPLLVKPGDVGKVAMRPFTPEHFQTAWASTQDTLMTGCLPRPQPLS